MIIDCPYPLISGLSNVEVVKGYCEVGIECVNQCSYRWKRDEEERVNKLFEDYTPKILL